ncbi:MAG: type IV toxin-antitoxin system AbiEi family antitoxin [Bacteroidota bacterium]
MGNTYIRLPSLLLHIKGEPRKETPKSTSKLTQAEVRALFFLISNPDLLTYSYRKLEPILGVGVATLSKLFSFLKVKGFINPDVRPFSFENLEELKDFWIASYGETLKPRLLRGRFRFSKNGGSRSWETWELGKEVLWSGEAALARISDYYLPGEWEIYTSLPTIELIKRYRIIPDSEGAIGVYQKFWNEAANLSLNIPSLAPDLLIEADIKLGGKARASQIFRDRYAQHA